jgi:hypothetical protein
MKKNMLIFTVMLSIASSLLATNFFNETFNNIRILEHAGKKYNLRAKPESGNADMERLESGLRDDLAIQIVGGPQLHFKLREIKNYLGTIQKAVLRFSDEDGYLLHLEGKPRGNKDAAFNQLATLCELWERKPRCWVQFRDNKERLVLDGLKPEEREVASKKVKSRRARG